MAKEKPVKKKKKDMTEEELAERKINCRRRRRKVLRIILYIILTWACVGAVVRYAGYRTNMAKVKSYPSADIPKDVKFTNIADGEWNIETDHGLKVMQLTDVHIAGGYMSARKDAMALNAVAAMITEEKPDFVIVTGDLSYPVPFLAAGTVNNKTAGKLFAELMETLGVNWTLCFGNHDTEAYSLFNREQMTEFYSSGKYPHCLMQRGPKYIDGYGNQVFNVVDSNGVIIRSLILFDSHSYADGDIFGTSWKYDNIHDNQIKWYRDTITRLNKENLEKIASLPEDKQKFYDDNRNFHPLRSSCFFHIPLEEYRDAWYEYSRNGFRDTENVKYNYGVAGEGANIVYPGMKHDDLFETMKELGSTDSVFVGHDHLNNFSLNYKGIDLNYGMSIDYLAYVTMGIDKLGTQRGCKMIWISEDGTLTSRNENYYQDKYKPFYKKEKVTMQKVKPTPAPEKIAKGTGIGDIGTYISETDGT